MRLVDENGHVRTHKSLTRPDRRLLIGCDRNRLFDVLMFGSAAIMLGIMNLNLLGVLIAVVVIIGVVWYLRMLGKESPYFFPIYRRANREQTVYLRSSHVSARVRPTPHQQSQKEEA